MAFAHLHRDPELSLASVVGFVAIGKLVAWLGYHAEFFAALSYILGSVAAIASIYYKIKENRKKK